MATIWQTLYDELSEIEGLFVHWNTLPQRDDPDSTGRPALVLHYDDGIIERIDCQRQNRQAMIQIDSWVNASCCKSGYDLDFVRCVVEQIVDNLFGQMAQLTRIRPMSLPKSLQDSESAQHLEFTINYTRLNYD